MNKKVIMLTALMLYVPSVVCYSSSDQHSLTSGATLTELTQEYPVHWVSVSNISSYLQNEGPVNVGFDIDDTVLYSSALFNMGKQKYSPGSDDYLKNESFWEDVYQNDLDRWYSIPKKSIAQLINMHVKRNDKIIFITARPAPKDNDNLTLTLQQLYNIPSQNLQKVIYAGTEKGSKTQYIKSQNVKIYYGDADSDMIDARNGGAEGIRVLRALNSTNQPAPKNGVYGEKVLINSWY